MFLKQKIESFGPNKTKRFFLIQDKFYKDGGAINTLT